MVTDVLRSEDVLYVILLELHVRLIVVQVLCIKQCQYTRHINILRLGQSQIKQIRVQERLCLHNILLIESPREVLDIIGLICEIQIVFL